MLLRNLDLLTDDPTLFLYLVGIVAVGLIVAITVHEFGHALTATIYGDTTAKRLGRLSLNPLKHLDPFGTLMIFLVGFGWGKPVPVDYRSLGRNPRRAMAVVSLSGAFFNVITAALFGIIIRAGVVAWHSPRSLYIDGWEFSSVAADIVGYIIFFNLILAVFNLIPIAPLDGFKVVVGFLPSKQAYSYARLERYGPIMLLTLLLFGYMTGILWDILIKPVEAFIRIFTGGSF
ncbi:MAG: site-2 protease family protein [Dehalococcoidia bacterium]|nr:MAG: site-2 protease family protein [Dehalococcoidia bacterium]